MISVTSITAPTSELEFQPRGKPYPCIARYGEARLDVSEQILQETFRGLREDFEWDEYRATMPIRN